MMPFKIGNRVVPLTALCIRCVGPSNIGTIIDVDMSEDFYIIQWDNKGPQTYYGESGPFQWNVDFDEVALYENINTKTKPNDKYYKVCLKIAQMKQKRERKGYAF